MLLATATPVQLRPIESVDLLDVLSRGSEANSWPAWSRWRQNPGEALKLVLGGIISQSDLEKWEWIRTPFPQALNIETSR